MLKILNDGQGNEYKKDDAHVLVRNKVPPLPRKRYRVSRGTINRNNSSFSPDHFLIILKHHVNHNLSDLPKFCQVALLAINKDSL